LRMTPPTITDAFVSPGFSAVAGQVTTVALPPPSAGFVFPASALAACRRPPASPPSPALPRSSPGWPVSPPELAPPPEAVPELAPAPEPALNLAPDLCPPVTPAPEPPLLDPHAPAPPVTTLTAKNAQARRCMRLSLRRERSRVLRNREGDRQEMAKWPASPFHGAGGEEESKRARG